MNIKDKVFSHEIIYINNSRNGLIRGEIKSNGAMLYQIPRASISETLKDNDELKHAGIYLLVNTDNKTVYVGQADSRDNGNGLLARMIETHSSEEIDNWNFGYAITSGNPAHTLPSELNYLERFFYDEATKVGRYKVINVKRPHAKDVLKIKMSLESLIESIAFLLEEIKCDIFIEQDDIVVKTQIPETPKVLDNSDISGRADSTVTAGTTAGAASADADKSDQSRAKKSQLSQDVIGKTFYLKNANKNVDAAGVMADTKSITVKAGTTVCQNSSLPNQKGQEHAATKRQGLIDSGVIVDFTFVKDYQFSSTTIAAAVLLGQSANGITAWKDDAGKELKSYALSTGN